jgi:hypothetical protein
VSLLMDALRRAEEAKRQAASPTGSDDPLELSLDPLESAPSGPQPWTLPPLSSPPDADATGPAAEATRSPPSRPLPGPTPADPRSNDAAARAAARNVFAVKQAPRSRTALWLFLGLGGIATLAIGVYFWWQLQAISAGSLARPLVATLPAAQPPGPPRPPPLMAVAEAPPARPPSAAGLPRPEPAPSKLRAVRPERLRRRRREFACQAKQRVFSVPGNKRAIHNQTLNQAYEAWQADNRLDDAQRRLRGSAA